jgi:hypothetical protein
VKTAGAVSQITLAIIATLAAVASASVRDGGAAQSSRAALQDPDDPKLAGHFAGRVVGPDGQPVAGARVFVVPVEPALPAASGPVRAMSGADGQFEFDAPDMTFTELDGLPARRQGLLFATADDYQPDWIFTWGRTRNPVRTHWDPEQGGDLTLRLARNDVPIHGRLLDHNGEPLAGARVQVVALSNPWQRDLDVHLKAFAAGRERLWTPGHERPLYPNVLPGVTTQAIADSDGRFQMPGMGRDRLASLVVSAPGVVDSHLTVMTRDDPDVITHRDSDGYPSRAILGAGFTLKLKPGRTLRGFVRDRETRAPIAGVKVVAGNGLGVLRGLESLFSSDANGRYAIWGIGPGVNNLQVMAIPQPGQPYFLTTASVGERSGAILDCARGIPFRLKLLDQDGMPTEGNVEYRAVMPNPHVESMFPGLHYDGTFPLSRAAMTEKGVFEGIVIPGPGAVMVTALGAADYRAAHVDPKAFFAPGKTDWTNQELISTYGAHDTLIVGYGGAWIDQHDYASIVLVNPAAGSEPLELAATIHRIKPRMVTIVDPDGKPVVGVQTQGLTAFPWDPELPLRAATIPITKLRTTRGRRITFLKQDRKLIGFLLARGDGEAPYTVRLQPWAAVTGRIVDEDGNPLPPRGEAPGGNSAVGLGTDSRFQIATHDDPLAGTFPECSSENDGRFGIARLVPGLRYRCDMYPSAGRYAGVAFENLVLKPGETRDLGDIRWTTPVDIHGK